jgi:hypothetical protein
MLTDLGKGTERKIENLLLFVRRLDPKKGIPVPLQSLRHLKTPVKLVMIGPPSTYEDYSKSVAKLRDDTGALSIQDFFLQPFRSKTSAHFPYQSRFPFAIIACKSEVNIERTKTRFPIH